MYTLKQQCNLEDELECSKHQMAMKQDFNIPDAFMLFDSSRSGIITLHDLMLGLNHIGVFPHQDEV